MVTSRYATSMAIKTDGSLIEEYAGYANHRTEESGFGYKMSSPVGIFTADFTDL
jgi:hypothetical protein